MDGGHIALQGAVGFDGDKPPLGAQAAALGRDDPRVLRVDLRDHHGHVRRSPVGAVVGYHRHFGFGIGFFQLADLLFLHIHCTEDKIHFALHGLNVLGVFHHQVFHILWNGPLHHPAAFHRLAIGLAGAAARSRNGGDGEPGVMLQQRGKPLPHHAGAAHNAYTIFFLHWLIFSFAASSKGPHWQTRASTVSNKQSMRAVGLLASGRSKIRARAKKL